MRRSQTLPTESELLAQIETLCAENAAARPRLRRLLSEGKATASVRIEIAAIARRVEDLNEAVTALRDERESQAEAACAAEAARLEQQFAGRIQAMLASLQAPPHPEKDGHDHV
jgi:hypothetical protein